MSPIAVPALLVLLLAAGHFAVGRRWPRQTLCAMSAAASIGVLTADRMPLRLAMGATALAIAAMAAALPRFRPIDARE